MGIGNDSVFLKGDQCAGNAIFIKNTPFMLFPINGKTFTTLINEKDIIREIKEKGTLVQIQPRLQIDSSLIL